MSVRTSINEHPAFGFVVGGLALVVAIGLIVRWQSGRAWADAVRDARADAFLNRYAFFTVDDGKTWFEEPITRLPPFQKDGKTAYGALLGECADEPPFVIAVYKFEPAAIARFEQRMRNRDVERLQVDMLREVLMRRPDSEKWIRPAIEPSGSVRWTDCASGARPIELWVRAVDEPPAN